MKRTRSFRMVAAGVVVALTSAVAVQTTTQTASAANDYQIIYDNLDDALGVLLTGFGDAVTDYLATQSFQSAAQVLSGALAAAGAQLVAGASQFALLAFGLGAMVGAFQASLDPFLAALDDPFTAADLFSQVDLETIALGLPAFVSNALTGGAFYGGVLDAVALVLQGQVFNGLGGLVLGIIEALFELLAPGYVGFFAPPLQLAGLGALAPLLVAFQFGGDYIAKVETALQAQLATGVLAAVAAPVAALLSGFTIPALPFP